MQDFKVGDMVVHPSHGVGKIAKLESKQLAGSARLYYEVITQKSTVWVPVDAGTVLGMRPLTSKHDLTRFRRILKNRPAHLDDDHRKRRLDIADRLKDGSLEAVCELVRDLSARGWRKPLNESDTATLRKAREKLFQEWAAADGVPVADAIRDVEHVLSEAREEHMH